MTGFYTLTNGKAFGVIPTKDRAGDFNVDLKVS